MHGMNVAVGWMLGGLILIQLPLVIAFIRALRRGKTKLPTNAPCPNAAVILCLRGKDPYLADAVRAIVQQDYPNFTLFAVVDAPEDPAWEIVEQTLAETKENRGKIEPLVQRRTTCSLKCSSVVQVIESLDPSFEMVALIDADTIPHPTWLRELAAPLADPRVGATTGNRWYMPHDASWGSLVRYLWNAAAVVQMYCYGIAWGGTLAIRRDVFQKSDLLDRWSHAFCEDTMLKSQLAKLGLRIAFVPSLMMVNREQCDLGGFFSWVQRQLLTARLYHPYWPAVVVHGISVVAAPVIALSVAGYEIGIGQPTAALSVILGLLAYGLAQAGLLLPIELAVRSLVRARGETTRWLSAQAALKLPAALVLTQFVYAAALAAALRLHVVAWRGIRYRIDGPLQIRLLEYHPFATSSSPDQNVSL